MRTTIKDVAKEAGVATSTVSRVLHDHPRISEATKQIVHKAMEKLNYHPNMAARSLAGKLSHTLGLIFPNDPEELFRNPFFIQAMRGLSIYAQEHGYSIMYSFSNDEEESVNFIKGYTRGRRVDGIILFTSRENDQCIRFLREASFPFAIIGRPQNTDGVLWVDNDNFQATYQIVNHLINQGHRKIGYIGGPLSFTFSKNRLEGYKQGLLTRGLAVDENLIYEGRKFAEQTGRNGITTLLKRTDLDALITTDDLLAFGALEIIQKHAKKVAVVGFNNTLRGTYQIPSLSSIDINPEQLGYHAAKLLIDKLEGRQNGVDHYIIPTKLIERDTTKNLIASESDSFSV